MPGSAVKIANLQIEISDNSKTATTSLAEFVETLKALKDATSKGAGLGSVATGLNNINKAVSKGGLGGLDALAESIAKAVSPAESLASAMERIAQSTRYIKYAKGLQSAVRTAKKLQAQATPTSTTAPNKGRAEVNTATLSEGAIKAQESIDKASEKIKQFKQYATDALEVLKQLKLPDSISNQIQKWIDNIDKIPTAIQKVKTALQTAGNFGKNILGNILPTSISRLASQFMRLAKMKVLRTIISNLMKGFSEGLQNAYYWAKLTGDQFAGSMDTIATSMNYAKNTIGAAFATVLNAVAPVIDQLVDWLVTGINYINMFFAALGGASTYMKAKKIATNYGTALDGIKGGASGASGAVKELEEQLSVLDFDELNQLSEQNVPSGGGGGGTGGGNPGTTADYANMFERAGIDNKIREIADFLRRNFDDILDIVKAIGMGILGWKLATAFSDSIKELSGLQKFGVALMFAGFTLEAIGAYGIGYNGFNLKDALKTFIGAALGVTGSLLLFGTGPLGWTVGIGLAIFTFVTGYSMGKWQKLKDELEATSQSYQQASIIIESASKQIQTANDKIAELKLQSPLDNEEYKKWVFASELIKKISSFEGIKADKSTLGELQLYVDEMNKILEEAGLSDFVQIWVDSAGAIHTNAENIQTVIDKMLELAKIDAMKDLYSQNLRTIFDFDMDTKAREEQNKDLQKTIDENNQFMAEYEKELEKGMTGESAITPEWTEEYNKAKLEVQHATEAINLNTEAIEANNEAVDLARRKNRLYAQEIYGVAEAYRTAATDLLTYTLSNQEILKMQQYIPSSVPTPYLSTPTLNLPAPKQQTPMYAGMMGYKGSDVTNTTTNKTSNTTFYSSVGAEFVIEDALAYVSALKGVQQQEQANIPYQNALEQTYFDLSNQMDKSADYGMAYKNVLVGMNTEQNANALYVGTATNKLSGYISSIINAGNASQTSAGQTGMINTELNKVGVGVAYAGIAAYIKNNLNSQTYKGMADTQIKNPIEGQVNLTGQGVKGSSIYSKIGGLIGSQPFSKIGTGAKGNIEDQVNKTGQGVNASSIYGTVSNKSSAQPWSQIGIAMVSDMLRGFDRASYYMRDAVNSLYYAVQNASYRCPWQNIGENIGWDIKEGLRWVIGSFDFNVQVKANGRSYNVGGYARAYFAQGGFPESGSAFIAGERGAELVGTVGGRTGVANREQIASAIAQAMRPMLAQGAVGGTQTTNVVVKLDSATIARANLKGQNAMNKQFNITAKA